MKLFLVAYLAGFGFGAHLALGFVAASHAMQWYRQPVAKAKVQMDSLVGDDQGRLYLMGGGWKAPRELSEAEVRALSCGRPWVVVGTGASAMEEGRR